MLSSPMAPRRPLVMAAIMATVSLSTARILERMAAATPWYAGDPSLPTVTSMPAPYGGLFPLEKRQNCPEGQSLCGRACAFDCCDAEAGWRCPIQGEKCYTKGGYIGCCAGELVGPVLTCAVECADSLQQLSVPIGVLRLSGLPGLRSVVGSVHSLVRFPCNPRFEVNQALDSLHSSSDATNRYCVTELNRAAGLSILYCATRSIGAVSYVTGTASPASQDESSLSSSSTSTGQSSSEDQSTSSRSTTTASTTSSSRETSTSATDPPSSSLSGGSIAGIVFGAVGVLGLAILAAAFLIRRKRRREAALAPAHTAGSPSDTPGGGYSQPSPNVLGAGSWQQPQYHPVPSNYTEMEDTQMPAWSPGKPAGNFAELPDSHQGPNRY